jgi:hypothetical protein
MGQNQFQMTLEIENIHVELEDAVQAGFIKTQNKLIKKFPYVYMSESSKLIHFTCEVISSLVTFVHPCLCHVVASGGADGDLQELK